MAAHIEVLPDPLPTDPLAMVSQWLQDAWAARSQPNANSMVLATSSRDGRPSARVVLCKDIVSPPGYVVFYTNYLSAKGRQLQGQSARRGGHALGRAASPGAHRGPGHAGARRRQRSLLRRARLAEPDRRVGQRTERAARLARAAARRSERDGAPLRRADARLAGSG